MSLQPTNADWRMTPELLITLAQLISYRDRHGFEKCRKTGVGAVRKVLSSDPALPVRNVVGMGASPSFVSAHVTACEVLEHHCRICRGCKLGRE